MNLRCFSFVAGVVMVRLVMVWLSSLVVRLRGCSRGGETKTDIVASGGRRERRERRKEWIAE